MILFTHICIALASLVFTGITLLVPSAKKIAVSFVLVALTLGTGIALAVLTPAHITQVCESGVTYLVIVMAGIFAARYRLSQLQSQRS